MTEKILDTMKPGTASVNAEWNDVQDHANDLPPVSTKRKNLFSITGADLDRSFHNDRGSTQASHIGESLDED